MGKEQKVSVGLEVAQARKEDEGTAGRDSFSATLLGRWPPLLEGEGALWTETRQTGEDSCGDRTGEEEQKRMGRELDPSRTETSKSPRARKPLWKGSRQTCAGHFKRLHATSGHPETRWRWDMTWSTSTQSTHVQ